LQNAEVHVAACHAFVYWTQASEMCLNSQQDLGMCIIWERLHWLQ